MLDLDIKLWRLDVRGGSGQQHRLGPVAARAAVLLARRWADASSAAGLVGAKELEGSKRIEDLRAPRVQIDLSRMTDEQAAIAIASACLEALLLKL